VLRLLMRLLQPRLQPEELLCSGDLQVKLQSSDYVAIMWMIQRFHSYGCPMHGPHLHFYMLLMYFLLYAVPVAHHCWTLWEATYPRGFWRLRSAGRTLLAVG